jgi:hypothetical protein
MLDKNIFLNDPSFSFIMRPSPLRTSTILPLRFLFDSSEFVLD